MPKVNCWEWKKCGRQEGGAKVAELGVCPAANAERINGANCGLNGGRACWALAGTLCGGQVQGTFAAKLSNCMACDFYKLVAQEEGANLLSSRAILGRMA
ncbi:MAG: two-CW domain-containing protein [Terriglobales bacterium]